MSARRRVDVYNETGETDWLLVKEARYNLAMIGSNEGHTLTNQSMNENLTKVAVARLHTGVHHWLHVVTTEEAAKKAAFFLSVVRGCRMEYPVALDAEQDTTLKLPRDQLTDIVTTWCNQVQQVGYYVAVYADLDVLRNHLNWSRIKQFDLWLTQYHTRMSNESPASIWQHSNMGRVPGIGNGAGDVGLSLFSKDHPEITRREGFNNFPATAPPVQTNSPLSLDTRSKDMSPGEIYTVLARCREKPEVTVTGWDVIRASEPRLNTKGYGWLIGVTTLKPPVRHARIQVRSEEGTANCNLNVL